MYAKQNLRGVGKVVLDSKCDCVTNKRISSRSQIMPEERRYSDLPPFE